MFKRRILLTMPLVIALALIVSVGTSVGSKSILTDAETSSVYGGADCLLVQTEDTGCKGVVLFGTCSDSNDPNVPPGPWPGGEGCQGGWYTTCEEPEKYCIDFEDPPEYCQDDPNIPCTGNYDHWTCGIQQGECEVDYSATYDCTGTKRDAHTY